MPSQLLIIAGPLFTITGAVALGIIMRATGILKGDEASTITRVVLLVLLPVFVFSSIKGVENTTLSIEILKIPLLAYIVIGASCGLSYVVGKYILHLERRQQGAFILTSMFGSTGFIGLPLVQSLFPPAASNPNGGSPMILQHAFYSELGSLTLLVTVGVMIASYYGDNGNGEKRTLNWRVLLDIPKNGPFLGMLLGLLFYTLNIPQPVLKTLTFLGQATLPLMMFSLGLTIVWKDVRKYLAPVICMNIIKLILVPIFALLVARLFGLDVRTQSVIVLNAATPAVIICLVYAAQYNLDREFASTAVFSSFFFCLVTIPIITLLLPPA